MQLWKGRSSHQLSKLKAEPVPCQRLLRERWQGADPALPQDKSFPAQPTGTHFQRQKMSQLQFSTVTSGHSAVKLCFLSDTTAPHTEQRAASRQQQLGSRHLFVKYSQQILGGSVPVSLSCNKIHISSHTQSYCNINISKLVYKTLEIIKQCT